MKKPELQIADPEATSRRRFTISLGRLLAISFGSLVALSIGAVLTLSVMANFVNTFSLLNDRAIDLFDAMEQRVKTQAHQVERTVSTIARLYAQDKAGSAGSTERRAIIETLLLGMPAVEGVFAFEDGKSTDSLFRRPEGAIGPAPEAFAKADLVKLLGLEKARVANDATWNDPVVIGDAMFHSVTQRLVRDGETKGVAVAVIGRNSITRMTTRLGEENEATVFMLGENNAVIAHSGLPDVFRDRITIPLAEFPDETMRELANTQEEPRDFERATEHGIHVYVSRSNKSGHLYMLKELSGYAASAFKLGVYYRKADIGAEILRTRNSLIAGAVGLVAAVLAAVLLGRSMSRPMRQIARTATQFSNFEIDAIKPVPRSRVREVDDQAVALNRMRGTLQQITRYVPRELVARLMRSGTDAGKPVERDMTVMFTDIVGFTTLSERMSAAEVTSLLNTHFAMITKHVQETGGTIDKFLGDGVMAFWGAPEADAEHALHAVQSASAIALSMRRENAARRERGAQPLRLRIGIHTGRVVVGDIGGDDRQNYTIVGDTVNVAQRIEQMARDLMADGDDTVVLASADVVKAVEGTTKEQASFTPAGTRVVRGREKPIAVSVLNVAGVRTTGNVVPFAGSGQA